MSTQLKSVTAPLGFRAAGGTFGIKASGKPDLALIVAEVPCRTAAVFTTNKIASEPVVLGRKHIARGSLRAIVCNSGNANAATGRLGMANALSMCKTVASLVGCKPTQVLACSTGIIGRHLPMEKITPGIQTLAGKLSRGDEADAQAAVAIMTTDIVPKAAVKQVTIGGKTVTLGGICKGSGMIAPNMATMLSFITTDAAIGVPALRAALKLAVNADGSFNRLSVDQHMSCSDTVCVMASGLAGNAEIRSTRSKEFAQFVNALGELSRALAYQIISDGEGVTKVIRCRVTGAKNDADAVKIAREIVNSPLVKCAVHGGDPNWGRIVTAAGYAGVEIAPLTTSLKIGSTLVYKKGQPTPVDLKVVQEAMKQKEVLFELTVGRGKGRTEFLGCDLSKDYVSINADYTT
jgi:glutamate N-acetyltransferase/amino-acid N-acetyltransferase